MKTDAMEMQAIRLLLAGAFLLLLLSCATTPSKTDRVIEGMDPLIEVISMRTVDLLDPDTKSTLAVYYFTVEGEESGISEYLINDLTTTIANLGRDKVEVVSRQALDRILSEYSFQMSDLADKENQVLVGRQLGADLILTGFITPVSDYFKLNAQLIQVETGVVEGGYIVSFQPEDDFQKKIALAEEVSRTVTVEEKAVSRTGTATLTSLLETFDKGTSTVQLSHFPDYWGDRIVSATGEIGMDMEGSADGSPCVVYSFQAELESEFSEFDWQESYLDYYFDMKTSWDHSQYDGIHLSLKLENFSLAHIFLKQQQKDDDVMFAVPIFLSPDEWHDVRIPFYDFYALDYGKSIDPETPVTISIAVNYGENYSLYHFRTGDRIEGRIRVDNIGFYEVKGVDDNALLDSFDDEISRMVVVPEIYGTGFYWDYSESDSGVLKETQGILNQKISLRRVEDGPSGKYLSFTGELEVAEDFTPLVEEDCCISVFFKMRVGKDIGGFKALSFSMRSNVLPSGQIEIMDNQQNNSYYAEFELTPIWTHIRIPFSDFSGGRRTLADHKESLKQPYLAIYLDIPHDALKRGVSDGRFLFTVDMDEFVLLSNL